MIKGWYWSKEETIEKKSFDQSYIEIKEWISSHNKIPSSASFDKIEKKLGSQCSRLRELKRTEQLSEDKIKKLEDIEGWIWGRDEKKTIRTFDESCEETKKWVILNSKMPRKHSDNDQEKRLGQFCYRQRHKKDIGELSNDEINKLELIDGWKWNN